MTRRGITHGDESSGCILSPCGRYRYRLWRRWDSGFYARRGLLTFIMLNPSTADHTEDDPTIRRCIGFAKREGFDGLVVVNLFALRAPDPKELRVAEDPIGAHNAAFIRDSVRTANKVVGAWGSNAAAIERAEIVAAGIQRLRPGRLFCLGTTKAGAPRHPLYVKADTPLQPFTPKQENAK